MGENHRYRDGRDSIYLELFGRSPQTRIVDFFLDNPSFEFSRPEIIQALGMAKVTIYRVFPSIVKSGMVVNTRKVGNAELFKLNVESDDVRSLISIIRNFSAKIAELEDTEPEPITIDVKEKELALSKS
ncbi:hypothetical protein JXL21_08650 [Candidatus Bathyarchaeota archaeon]|nr:hypothetical protein [Candidatus Bathyarchaeota archaeon]